MDFPFSRSVTQVLKLEIPRLAILDVHHKSFLYTWRLFKSVLYLIIILYVLKTGKNNETYHGGKNPNRFEFRMAISKRISLELSC